MEWKVNNFQWGTDRQENGEMQEGDDLSGVFTSDVLVKPTLPPDRVI